MKSAKMVHFFLILDRAGWNNSGRGCTYPERNGKMAEGKRRGDIRNQILEDIRRGTDGGFGGTFHGYL